MKLYQATLFSLVLITSLAQADVENSQWITTWSASPQKSGIKTSFFQHSFQSKYLIRLLDK